jgi:radical SAM superfamily enzyme YgiQ (UPF0313 family)
MKNILLLSTSIEVPHRDENTKDSHYPLGLIYIHSFLEKNGFNIETLFLNNVNENICQKTIEEKLSLFKADYIGLQMISHNRLSTYKTLNYLHENYPDKKLVVGGVHATVMYEQILKKFPFIYAIVLGEGEETFLEIVNEKKLEEIKGIAFFSREKGEVVKTEKRELIDDLDSLPFPKHELFLHDKKTLANLLTSRGCPFSCSFCVLDKLSRKRVRYRTANNVVNEIEYILTKFPSVKTIWIHDDAFFLNNKRAIEICEEIVKRNIKTNFICSARFKPISPELISSLEKAGFVQVLFGLESGSEQILNSIHKKITKNDVRNTFQLFKNSTIKITAFLIVGLPGETTETLQETIDFIKEIQEINYSYYDDVGILAPYVGTEVYEIAKQSGILSDEYWLEEKPLPFYTVDHSYEKLLEFKEILRDNISLNRIFTSKGLNLQKKLIPSIIKYSYKFNIPIINQMVSKAVATYGITREQFISAFFETENKEVIQKISLFVYREIAAIANQKKGENIR